jgi:hypothetical protein
MKKTASTGKRVAACVKCFDRDGGRLYAFYELWKEILGPRNDTSPTNTRSRARVLCRIFPIGAAFSSFSNYMSFGKQRKASLFPPINVRPNNLRKRRGKLRCSGFQDQIGCVGPFISNKGILPGKPVFLLHKMSLSC